MSTPAVPPADLPLAHLPLARQPLAHLPLVLLPGMLCDRRLFEPVLAALPPRTVIVPSLDGAETVGALAAHLLETLPPRFALGGFSLGGIIAQDIALLAPERVDRLCLIGTTAAPEPEGMAERRTGWIDRARQMGLPAFVGERLWPFYVAATHREDAVLREAVVAMARDAGIEAYARQSRLLGTSPDHRSAIATLTLPTLVLCGAQDLLCPEGEHRELAGTIPGSRLVVVPEAGHFVTIEQPTAVAAALREWLAA